MKKHLSIIAITALLHGQPLLPDNYMPNFTESAKIVGTCIGAASLYGVLHDQVTYRHCPEYFTKGFHENMMKEWPDTPLSPAKSLFDNHPDNPTLRATIWGIVASWWMGAIMGVPVALACQTGPWNKLTYKDIILLLTASSITTGLYATKKGFEERLFLDDLEKSRQNFNTQLQRNLLPYELKLNELSTETGKRYLTCAKSHSAAYTAGPISCLLLIPYILYKRYQLTYNQ